MTQAHYSLKHALTKSILLWSASFLMLLGILFLFTFNSLERFMLNTMANQQLDYQVIEYSKHTQNAPLASDPTISAILLIDASGKLLHASLRKHQAPQITMAKDMNIDTINKLIASEHNLHLFQRKIPNSDTSLALILDDRNVDITILSTTLWTGGLLLLFLLTSIKALHFTLKRRLVNPVTHMNQAIGKQNTSTEHIQQLEEELPNEAVDIIAAYDKLKQSRNVLQSQVSNMMQALSACFWWSDDIQTYTGISEQVSDILNQPAASIQGTALWAWTENTAQMHSNTEQLMRAIEQHDKKLDIAYQIDDHDQANKASTWYGECITLCYDDQGQISTIFGTINDISKRKNQQQEQAEQLELLHRMETTGTLVGGIAHEFNNALAGMSGNIFLIKESPHDKQNLKRIARIESLIDRSANMVDSMLAFARKGAITTQNICLADFLQKLHTAILPSLGTNLELHISSDSHINTTILADPTKLQEAFIQLIDNAKLALTNTPTPCINIRLQQYEADRALLQRHPRLSSRHLIHVSFHDNGCGIADHIQDRIFEPFFTTREVGQGTGLGLSMIYGYINQLGGAIDIESSTKLGTTFHLYFPCQNDALVDTPSNALMLGDGEKILVVDDETTFRESTCEVLQRMGYRTVEARDGKEAVQVFEQHHQKIRLILMDILMPQMTGTQASKEIRRIAPTIPIIYLTAYDRTEPMEQEVYEKHAELINKPFRISTLSQAIQKALHKTEQQIGLFHNNDNNQ